MTVSPMSAVVVVVVFNTAFASHVVSDLPPPACVDVLAENCPPLAFDRLMYQIDALSRSGDGALLLSLQRRVLLLARIYVAYMRIPCLLPVSRTFSLFTC